MGRYVFKLPDVGEGVAEAEIMKWHAAVGDDVGEEQPLVDIMTDKATVEIVSPVAGRIVSRNGEEGSKLAVGSEFVVFEVEGGEAAARACRSCCRPQIDSTRCPAQIKRKGDRLHPLFGFAPQLLALISPQFPEPAPQAAFSTATLMRFCLRARVGLRRLRGR